MKTIKKILSHYVWVTVGTPIWHFNLKCQSQSPPAWCWCRSGEWLLTTSMFSNMAILRVHYFFAPGSDSKANHPSQFNRHTLHQSQWGFSLILFHFTISPLCLWLTVSFLSSHGHPLHTRMLNSFLKCLFQLILLLAVRTLNALHLWQYQDCHTF